MSGAALRRERHALAAVSNAAARVDALAQLLATHAASGLKALSMRWNVTWRPYLSPPPGLLSFSFCVLAFATWRLRRLRLRPSSR